MASPSPPLREADLDAIESLGADSRVMAVFGGPLSRKKSGEWLGRILTHWQTHGYGRFFVQRAGRFVGVVGLSRTDFDAGIVPGVEIAWRLLHEEWGKGYAAEAARAVIVTASADSASSGSSESRRPTTSGRDA